MTLAAGERLGPYEIVAPVGAGGMGEVYRARDSRLGREVAVKVLPESFSKDPDRLRRFEQEARAAGILNHPNVLAIYDIGTHNGSPYVVSELLEGETLRERLAGGPLSSRKAVELAVQMAHGLAAAHDKGIVHRDLKPENVYVTKDQRIKILDFGLAKLAEPRAMPEAMTEVPTTPANTAPGLVLGTVGYMSPEQVRGLPADHRSDLFSFGAILYEMLSGQRAFQGGSAVETMSAILKQEPPDLTETNRQVPPALERVVRHCLEKRPEDRFQSARDLAFNLESLSGISTSASGAAQALAAPARSRRWLLAVAAGALVVLAVALCMFVLGERAGRTPPPEFHQLTFRRGTMWSARFAPDGHTVIYDAAWDGKPIELFSTRPGSPESTHMDVPSAHLLAISSAGEMAVLLHPSYVGVHVYSGTLARVPLSGGAPREVLENVQFADWSPDGKDLAVVLNLGTKYRLEYPLGKALYETAGWISHARVSPDGNRVAFLDHAVASDDHGSVAVVDRAGKKTTLTGDYSGTDGLAWSPNGREIWYTAASAGMNRVLRAVTLGGRERVVLPVPGALTLADISRAGEILMLREDQRRGIVGSVPGASGERDLSWLDWSYLRDFSADGETILFDEEGEGSGNKYAVYLRKTDGSPAVRLGEGYGIGLSPDGKWALALTPFSNPPRIFLIPTGAGESRAITEAPFQAHWAGWMPDGKQVLISGSEPGHGTRLYIQDIAGGQRRVITPEGAPQYGFKSSPDGKSVFVLSTQGLGAIYPVAGGPPRRVPGLEAREFPCAWSRDGRTLYVFKPGELPARVFSIDLQTGKKQFWKDFMSSDPAGIRAIGPIFLTPEAKYYVYSYARFLSNLFLVAGLK